MKFLMVCLMSLMLSVQANTAQQSTVAGQVRLADGRPVVGAQVTLFDLADLHRGAVARAMTDESGYFALPLAALGGPVLPQGFALGANYPNPFNPSTVIPYQLPTATHVRLDVFNVLGQHVATLVDAEQQAGFHAAKWDATNAAGQAMAAGVYLYRLTVDGGQHTQRMVLIDGQAGIVAEAPSIAAPMSVDATEREYGLVVSGAGLTTYADAAFGVREGMAAVELVVDAAPLTRGQGLGGEILGDVNNDGQVVLEDAMLVVMHNSNPSIAMPNNGSILLGDVNGDGNVNETDVLVIMRYVSNPLDEALPAGIGQRIASGKRAADDSDSGVRRLTDDRGKDQAPAWSPNGRQIAFSSSRDGNVDIYVMAADGSDVRRLTDHLSGDRSPAWSPDGRHLAFSSSRDGGDDDIYVMAVDGSGVRRLTDHLSEDRSPAWSPDGRHLAFSSSRDGNVDIYVMAVDGSGVRRLTDHLSEDRSPAWSPDGRHLAFSSSRDGGDNDIYVMAADGSGVRRLTDDGGNDQAPAWSPNGRHLAFSSSRDGGDNDIYVMAADGSGVRRLTDDGGNDQAPAWSPDGRHLAFSSDRGGNLRIYMMDGDGDWGTPSFAEVTVADQTVAEGEAMTLVLPMASGGDGELRYSLSLVVPGLTFNGATRTLSGTPTATGDYVLTYRVEDSDGDADELAFTVTVTSTRADGEMYWAETFEQPTRSEKIVIGSIEVEAAENEILVFLEEDVSSAEIRDAEAEILNQGGSIKSLNLDLRTIQVGITDAIMEQDFINALSRQSGVSGANVNEVVVPDRSFITSNDAGYRQWRTRIPNIPLAKVPVPRSVSFDGDYWIEQIDAIRAWQALSEVSLEPNAIGIVDTGFPSSQGILDNSRISRYTERGDNLSDDDTPDTRHGLYVTGFAVGYGDNSTLPALLDTTQLPVHGAHLRGVNPHSDVVFVDVRRSILGSRSLTYVTDILQGIKTAVDKKAGVVNVSWGDWTKCYHSDSERQEVRQLWRKSYNGAVHYARKHDVLLVWSAGSNCEKQDDRLLPQKLFGRDSEDVANTDSWLSHTLIVGASTANMSDASFSRMGNVVNIMAPGELVGFGLAGPTASSCYDDVMNLTTTLACGTSFSAPMVTGAAGLVRAIESSISAEETRSILINSATNVITPEPPATNPTGLLNLGNAIQSALVADGVGLETNDDVYLSKGQTQSVQIDITVPAGGAHAIDVGFVIDQSGSYEDDITTLQTRAQDIVNSLRSRTDIDVQFGLAGFADFPQGGYGDEGDIEYRLYQNITGDSDALIAAIDKLNKPLMDGDDYPESQYEALFRAAQEIGWRDGTLRILLLATDADFHDSDTDPSYPGAGRRTVLATLETENVIVIGLQSGDGGDAAEHLQELAEVTGGSVLSLDAASSQIVDAIVRGLDAALADLDVRLDVLAGQSWVAGVSPTVHEGVGAGQTVSFEVSLEGQRDPSVEDLPYNVYIWARGDGAALLSRTKIPIIVSQE